MERRSTNIPRLLLTAAVLHFVDTVVLFNKFLQKIYLRLCFISNLTFYSILLLLTQEIALNQTLNSGYLHVYLLNKLVRLFYSVKLC